MLVNKKITVSLIIVLAVIFLLPDLAHAQANFGTNDLVNTGLGTAGIKDIIVNIVNIVLGFLGTLATLIILYGGWLWMTSRGNTEQVDKAKKVILNGVIGLVIILASYGIARFVIRQIYGATTPGGSGGGGGGGGYHGGVGIGGGVIDNHYPGRNATDIPRNTNIYITFKEPIKQLEVDGLVTNTGCDGYALCASDNLVLVNQVTGLAVESSKLEATVSVDGKVFGFNPFGSSNEHLGDVNGNTKYNLWLKSSLNKEDGSAAFGVSGYDWDFTVSNQIDLTPPTIRSVIPTDGSTRPRNTAVQINFSEAMNPLFASGDVAAGSGFNNITVSNGVNVVDGFYTISNQYRTVEFLTSDLCGVNSCGGNVYCLPGGVTLVGEVTDAVVDMAGNSLDGDNDGSAGGNYDWSFITTNQIDTTPPVISSMQSAVSVPINQPIEVTFSKSLLSSSVNSSNIDFTEANGTNINYWVSLDDNKIIIHHDKLKTLTDYKPTLFSDIKDSSQNCWYPCACDDPTSSSCLCDDTGCAGAYCETTN